MSLRATVRPWTRQTARLIGALVASWLAGTAVAVSIRTAFDISDAGRAGCAAIAAAAGLIALPAAAVAYRMFRDKTAGLTLGLAACGFAALAGLLAVPGEIGRTERTACEAATATTAAAIRMIGCCATVFTAVGLFRQRETAATVVGAATAMPLQALGAASAAISLILVEASAPVSIILAGLSSQDEFGARGAPASTPHRLSTRAIRANSWLTSLVVAFSARGCAGSYRRGGRTRTSPAARRSLGIAFADDDRGCAAVARSRTP